MNASTATASTGALAPQAVQPTTGLPQYTLRGVLGVWAAAALPMAALAWLVAPWLAHVLTGPAAWPRALLLSLTAGLLWQFVLVLVLVRHEQASLRWSVLREALWLHAPRSPRTGRHAGRLWLLLVPLALGVAAKEEIPKLAAPAHRDLATFLQSEAGADFMSGNWVWFSLAVAMFVLNTVVGEELLFRGVLLPRMNGVFGRADWVANGVLFAGYHLHLPWAIPLHLFDAFLLAYPSKRFRTALLGIAVHSVQTVVFTVLALTLVLA